VQRRPLFHVDYTYILAPMVGASELDFWLLCCKYGAQLAYTPMVSVTTFSSSQEYQAREF
jgi:tRNA-dihydrouridine synthase